VSVALQRMVAQRLVGPGLAGGAEVVRHLTCVQAQDLPGALASVRLRTAGGPDIAEALATGKVVRSWPMRGTLHLVAGEDLGWMLDLTSARQGAGAAARRRALGLTDEHGTRAAALARDALSGGRSLRREDLIALWEDAGLLGVPQRAYHLLWWISQTGVTCFGPLDGAEQRIVLLDEWVRRPRRLARPAALAEWVGRYFRSHGPATRADAIRWTGLTARDVDEGLAGASGLATVEIAGVSHHLDPDVPGRLEALGARARATVLLPGFDELLLGYADRSATLAPEHADRIVPGGTGMFRATIVDAGRVVGTWRHQGTGARRRVVAEPFGTLTARARRAVERA